MATKEALQTQRPTDGIIPQGSTKCARCGRRLTDPLSKLRGMGPVCWRLSRGDVFEKDLTASDDEWAKREKDLRAGAEVDFGCTWRYMADSNSLPVPMRVSIRYLPSEDVFEVYGVLLDGEHREISFGKTQNIKYAWHLAVNAGPHCEALTYRMTNAARRRSRRVA